MRDSFEDKWKSADPEDLPDRLDDIRLEDQLQKSADELTDIEDDDLPEL